MLDLNNKKVLVTGGCGFIGSNFVELIWKQNKNLTVCIWDKMGIGSRTIINNLSWLAPDNKNIIYEQHYDVKDIDRVISPYIKFDYIFHFAAESHVDRSINDPSLFFDNNVMGMVSLLEWIRQKQPQARFMNVSTDEVYGHLGKYDAPFDERSKFNPRSPYSASKASADMIANSYVNTYGLDIITTHCCNNFGKYQHDEKLIPTIVRKVIRGEKIPLYGTGQNIREWIHVDDHNNSLLEIAAMGRQGRRYNICSKVEKNNFDMVIDVCKILDRKPDIEYVEDRKGHDFRYAIDSIFYRRLFKLRDYEDALRETVEHYKEKYSK